MKCKRCKKQIVIFNTKGDGFCYCGNVQYPRKKRRKNGQ